MALDFYERIKGGNWDAVSSSEFVEWKKAVQAFYEQYELTNANPSFSRYTFGVLKRYGDKPRNNPNNARDWQTFFQQYASLANFIVNDPGIIPLSDAQRKDYRERLSSVLDFTPFFGDIKGVVEALTGVELITGRELALWERALGAIPVFGGVLRKAVKTGQQSELLVKLGDNVYGVFRGTKDKLEKLVKNLPGLGNDEFVKVVTPDGQEFWIPKDEKYSEIKSTIKNEITGGPGGGGSGNQIILSNINQIRKKALERLDSNLIEKLKNQFGTQGFQELTEQLIPSDFSKNAADWINSKGEDLSLLIENFIEKIAKAPQVDSNSFEVIYETIQLEKNRKIQGFQDWVEFAIAEKKTGEDLRNVILELQEANRLANKTSSETIQIGTDIKNLKVGEKISKSFDIKVKNKSGQIIRYIDIKTVGIENNVGATTIKQFTPPIRDTIEAAKLDSLQKTASKEVTIVSLFPHKTSARGGNMIINADGTYKIEYRDSSGELKRTITGDLIQEVAKNILKIPNINRLDSINIVSIEGNLVANILKTGNTWKVNRP